MKYHWEEGAGARYLVGDFDEVLLVIRYNLDTCLPSFIDPKSGANRTFTTLQGAKAAAEKVMS